MDRIPAKKKMRGRTKKDPIHSVVKLRKLIWIAHRSTLLKRANSLTRQLRKNTTGRNL